MNTRLLLTGAVLLLVMACFRTRAPDSDDSADEGTDSASDSGDSDGDPDTSTGAAVIELWRFSGEWVCHPNSYDPSSCEVPNFTNDFCYCYDDLYAEVIPDMETLAQRWSDLYGERYGPEDRPTPNPNFRGNTVVLVWLPCCQAGPVWLGVEETEVVGTPSGAAALRLSVVGEFEAHQIQIDVRSAVLVQVPGTHDRLEVTGTYVWPTEEE